MRKVSRAQFWITPVAAVSLAFSSACATNDPAQETTLSDDFLGSAPITTVVDYDDFSDSGAYSARWFDMSTFLSIGEPSIAESRAFNGNALNVGATHLTASYDLVYDHMKYFAVSGDAFDIPVRGAVMATADITASTPDSRPGRINQATGRRLMEGQQGAATFSLLDADDSGLHLSWWVSGRKAFALYERLMPEGQCTLNTAFTQIIGEIAISPGSHNYGIEYRRDGNSNAPDMVRFFADGVPKFVINQIGIPLDRQSGKSGANTTYASQGPGEALRNRLSGFVVGHGIGTMVDEFPFNQCPTGQVSVPAAERAFGQGVTATFDNVRIATTRPGT